MHDLEANTDSVNYLITALCGSLARDNGLDSCAAVAKLKSKSFEILLKKSPRAHVDTSAAEAQDFDPQRALDIQIFGAKLNATLNAKERQKFELFEQQLDAIKAEPYFQSDVGRGVLQLLLALQQDVQETVEMPITRAPELLVPGPFTLHANYQNNQHYPANTWDSVMRPMPQYFKGLQAIKNNENPYLPKFLFDGEPNMLTKIDQTYATSTPLAKNANANNTIGDCTFTGMAQRLWGAEMRINARPFRLFAEGLSDEPPKFATQQQQQQQQRTLKPTIVAAAAAQSKPETPRKFTWNWESLGCFGIPCARPFASDANIALNLQSYEQQMLGHNFVAKILTEAQFMQDLKSLTVGIQSDTFQHDQSNIFSMQAHITVDTVLPTTISSYINEFLECGTCYKSLQAMITKRDYKLMFEGFIFKALCSAIDEYLLTFRQYVFAQQDQHLLGFYRRMKKMMKQIVNLTYTLAIHPNVADSVKPPMGSQFLGYLYREIMRLTEKEYITLLMFILKRCCHVYFKHLQKWIFYGLLDDSHNELFICFVDHYRQRTKYFYDKAYFVRKESVPGFFQNFEDQILQCGKYTMLLKAYNSNHPLFDLDCPAINVCLSFDEIQKLELQCTKYYERAREVCGKPISIRQMFETRAEQQRNFFKMVSQRSRANFEKWTDEQHRLALLVAAQKKKRFDELTLQLQEAKQRKLDERRANVELELRHLRETEKLEDQRSLRENLNIRKRIEYYQEQSDLIQSDAADAAKIKHKVRLKCLSAGAIQQQRKQSPNTPSSTTATDFESCDGDNDNDEDGSSDYAECVSDDFVQKFERNESELQAICAGTDADNLANAAPQTNNEAQRIPNDNDDGIFVPLTLKRSISDVINSNELPALSTLQQNRQKALSGVNMAYCVKSDTTCLSSADGDLHVVKAPPLTDAQRNKLKVLTQEFGALRNDTHTKSMPDINLNTLPDSELTALQRNRRRMMHNDPFSEFNKDPPTRPVQLNLQSNTERARNRRKVLESEFHILTGESELTHILSGKKPASTTTFTVDAPVLTPMSTTSDTPLTEQQDELEDKNKLKPATDADNGNFLVAKATEALTLDVQRANDQQLQTDALALDTAATQTDAATPVCALNTAGLLSKQHGFDFVDVAKRKQQQKTAAHAALTQNNKAQQEEAACPTLDYSQPYQRCEQLITSNFQCSTRSPYFRMNRLLTPTASQISLAQQQKCKQLNLNIMSVITLTEFLQKSVTIPLSVHLELVNNEVMRMFLEDLRLLDHLRSLRHYFFLMDGEFGAIICDGIIAKLEHGATPDKLLNYQMLHAILENALGSSIIGHDRNAENLSFIVSDVPDKFELSSPSVLNYLSLSYSINWPLNLILNPETLEQYANIFRYLIKVRRISWVLERAYQMLKEAVKKHGKHILKSPQYRHVQLIRHKFYHFVHALQNHITANALQASWKTFKDDLLQAKTIEDIYRKHTMYVKRILFLCMLNRRSVDFYNTIENIFKITLRFYNNLKSREFKLRANDTHFTHTRYEKLANDELEFDKFIKYTIYLGNKIVRHGYQAEIGEFISLINYNQYYLEKNI